MTIHDLPVTHGVMSAADADRLAQNRGIGIAELMTQLLPAAATFARPPISNYRVGVVARGTSSGSLYFGANLEFADAALSFTVHAEQSAISNAWMHGEAGIDLLAVNAPPCGYCRQFLNELTTAADLRITMPGGTHTLAELLPHAFGPRDLGVPGGLMQQETHELTIESGDELAHAAAAAARRSYAPYSKSLAAVALQLHDGTVVTGAYAENAAFNPSISPLEVALSMLNLRGLAWDFIVEAALVATDDLHTSATRAVLAAIGNPPLTVVRARNSAAQPSR